MENEKSHLKIEKSSKKIQKNGKWKNGECKDVIYIAYVFEAILMLF